MRGRLYIVYKENEVEFSQDADGMSSGVCLYF